MKLNQTLSWKILLPIAFVVYIVFRSDTLGIFGDVLGLLAAILFAMGIIDLVRNLFKNKQ